MDRSNIREGCGTTACIAGWSVAVQYGESVNEIVRDLNLSEGKDPLWYDVQVKKFPEKYFAEKAGELLGIENVKRADELFYFSRWPKKYKEAHEKAISPKGRAYVVASRIAGFSDEISRPPKDYLPESESTIHKTLY